MTAKEMTFVEHLDELRRRLIKILVCFVACTTASFFLISSVLKLIAKPYFDCLTRIGVSQGNSLRSLGPVDAFQVTLEAACLFGLFLSLPWMIFQLWGFIGPALSKKEQKKVLMCCATTTFLFVLGVLFSYVAVLPATLSFFYTYAINLGIRPEWTILNYFKFVVAFLVGFGVVFELPVVVVILTSLRLITPKSLACHRRAIVVSVFIIAALITPGPDVVSQVLVALPMLVLFELSLLASKVIVRTSSKKGSFL